MYEAAGCVFEKQEQIRIYFRFTDDQLLLLMLQVACRPTCVCRLGCWRRGGGGERAHIAGFFKLKSATDGAKESPVLMDSSSGGGASGEADVVATGVVNRGEGGAGTGCDADVVVTGVVSKGESGAGAGSFADVVATGVVIALPVILFPLTFRASLD